jgi:lysophospholipase L1-like esterase
MYKDIANGPKIPLHNKEWVDVLANAQLRADSVHANAAGYAQFGDGPVGTRKNTGLQAKRWKLPFR